MKSKPKPSANGRTNELSAAQIARLAGVSTPLVYRKLAEGRAPAEIISAAHQRREQQVLRHLPTVKVDGVADNHVTEMPSFASAQAERERWSARLRKLEYLKASAEVVPVEYVRRWGSILLAAAKNEMVRAPSELADMLAAADDPRQVAAILERWVGQVMQKFYELDYGPGPELVKKPEVA